MTVDQESLWQAWPDGYLAMRGVSTVGGWLCLEGVRTGDEQQGEELVTFHSPDSQPIPHLVWKRGGGGAGSIWGNTDSQFDALRTTGHLLPNVDPAHVATWACLLADLAQALDWSLTPLVFHSNWRWGSNHPGEAILRKWTLEQHRVRVTDATAYKHFYLHADDPAEALVRARIQVRGETGR